MLRPAAALLPLLLLLALLGPGRAEHQAMEEAEQEFYGHLQECQHMHKSVSNETIQHAISHHMTLEDEENEEAKCFVDCVMKKVGFLPASGSFDVDMAMASLLKLCKTVHPGKKVVEGKLRQLLQRCGQQEKKSNCDKGYFAVKCTLLEMEEHESEYYA